MPEEVKWDQPQPSSGIVWDDQIQWDKPQESAISRGIHAFLDTEVGKSLSGTVLGAIGEAQHLITATTPDPNDPLSLITGMRSNFREAFSGRNLLEAILKPGTDNPLTDEIAGALAIPAARYYGQMAPFTLATAPAAAQTARIFGAKEETAQKVGEKAGEIAGYLGLAATLKGGEAAGAVADRIAAGSKLLTEALDMLRSPGITEAAGKGLSEGMKAPKGKIPPSVAPIDLARQVPEDIPRALTQAARSEAWRQRVLEAGPLDQVDQPPVTVEAARPDLFGPTGEGVYRADLDAQLQDIIARARARGLNIPETPEKIIKPQEAKPVEGPTQVGYPTVLPDWVQEGLERPAPVVPKEEVKPPVKPPTEEEQAARALAQPDRGDWLPSVRMKDGSVILGNARETHEAMVRRLGIDVQQVESTGWGKTTGEYTTEIPTLRELPKPLDEAIKAAIGEEKIQLLSVKAEMLRTAKELVDEGTFPNVPAAYRALTRPPEAPRSGRIAEAVKPKEPETFGPEPPRPIEDADMKGTMLMAFKLKDGRIVYDKTKSPNHGISAELLGIDPETVAATGMVNEQTGQFFDFNAGTVEKSPMSPVVPPEAQRKIVAGINPEKPQTLADFQQQIEAGADSTFPIPGLRIAAVIHPPGEAGPPGIPLKKYYDAKLEALNWIPGNTGMNQLNSIDEPTAAIARAVGVSGPMADSAVKMTSWAAEKIGAKYGVPKAFQKFDLTMTEQNLRDTRIGYRKLATAIEHASDYDVLDLYGNDPYGISYRLKTLDQTQHFSGRNLPEKADRMFGNSDVKGLRELLSKTFNEAADNVGYTSLTDAEFEANKASRWFQEVHDVAQKLMIGPLEEAHLANGGVPLQFTSELGYWPLISKGEPGLARKTRSGIPLPPANAPRTGLGAEYDMSLGAKIGVERTGYRANNTAALLKSLLKLDLIRKAEKGTPSLSYDWRGETYQAKRLEVFENFVAPAWLADEINPTLKRESQGLFERQYNPLTGQWEFKQKSLIGRFTTLATQAALLGPAEGVGHTFNIAGAAISKIPVVGEGLSGKILAGPIIKSPMMFARILREMFRDLSDPEIMIGIQSLVRNGDMHPRFLSVTWSRKFAAATGATYKIPGLSLSPLLYGPHGIDIAARLFARRMALYIEPEMSSLKMHQFMNNFGQYNMSLVDRTTRAIKSPFTPFITASTTAVRNAIHTLTGTGTMPGGLGYRLLNLASAGALSVTGSWILAHKMYRDQYPWEDPYYKAFQIRLKPEHRALPVIVALAGTPDKGDVYLNFGRMLNPMVERMARVTGMRGAAETIARGGDMGQAGEAARKDVLNTLLQMVAGPPVRFAVGLTFGIEPRIQTTRDRGISTSIFAPISREKVAPGRSEILNRLKSAVIGATPIAAKPEQAAKSGATMWRAVTDTVLPSILNGPIRNDKQVKALKRQLREARPKAAGWP